MESQPYNQAAKRPFFRRDPLSSIFFVIGVFLASQLLAALFIGLYPNLRNFTDSQATAWLNTVPAQFAYVCFAEILSIAFIFQLLKWANIKRERIGLIRPRALDVAYALSGYAIYFVLYIVIVTAAGTLFKQVNLEQKQELGFDDPAGTSQLILTFISLVILPPLAEEIMFRGFLFSSLRAKFRFRYALIITSILFGIAHLQFGSGAPLLWVAALDTFTLSCVLCYLREKTTSLWPGILLHALKNLIAFMALYGGLFRHLY